MHDFLQPIVHGVACEHLGLDFDDPVQFVNDIRGGSRYAGEASFPSDEVKERFGAAWGSMAAVVNARRENPKRDVISQLVQWKEPVFTQDEIERMILNVILGAGDTTTVSTALSFLYMDQHPELRAHFAANPEQIEPAFDEFLRLFSPTMYKGRTAHSDFEFNGMQVKAGERVMLSHWGANHDPKKYPDPLEFELNRKGVRQHFAMSFGKHFCLGAWLAKAIAAAALRGLLLRAPDLHVEVDRAIINDTVADPLGRWNSMPVRISSEVGAAGR
jgi:cytochrome P450